MNIRSVGGGPPLESPSGRFEYDDGTAFDYEDSTTARWCEGSRSVMREIGALEGKQAVGGESPSVGEVPIHDGTHSWVESEGGE